MTRVGHFDLSVCLVNGASAVISYVFVEKCSPLALGHGLTGLMSTVTCVLPVTSNAPGRKPITTWPSSVNAELASLTPPMTLITRWPDAGWRFAPAIGGGHTKL